LDPIRHPQLDTPLTMLVDCLNETKDILVANTSKISQLKKLVFPSSVVKKMTDLEGKIIQMVTIMNLSVSATQLVAIEKKDKLSALTFLLTKETQQFWSVNFGETIYAVKWPDLEKALIAKYRDYVDSAMLCDLQLRLDNLKTGFISCHRLSEFCGQETLSKRLSEYKENAAPVTVTSLSPQQDRLYFPLLLWVDDYPDHNTTELAHAKDKNICTVVVNTTAEAKQWIINHPTIMDIKEPHRVHIITDNAREGKGTTLDINAGEDIIRFVRGRRSTVPVLVYCGDLDYTKYVVHYNACRAVNERQGCISFIDELN